MNGQLNKINNAIKRMVLIPVVPGGILFTVLMVLLYLSDVSIWLAAASSLVAGLVYGCLSYLCGTCAYILSYVNMEFSDRQDMKGGRKL